MIEKITEQLGKLTLIANATARSSARLTRKRSASGSSPASRSARSATPTTRSPPDRRPGRHPPDRARSRAWIKIYGRAETTYKSRVSEIAKRKPRRSPHRALQHGRRRGRLQARPQDRGGQAPTAVYEVIIPIDNPDLKLEPGLRGSAKIDGGTYTLAWWLMRWWNKLFNFQL